MSQLGMVAAPEVFVPMEVGKQLAPHATSIVMMPIIGFSVLLILISIIIIAVAKHKTAGYLMLFLGLLTGGGAFFISYKSETKK